MTVLITPLIQLGRSLNAFRDELYSVIEMLDASEEPYAADCLDHASNDIESIRLWIKQARNSVARQATTDQAAG